MNADPLCWSVPGHNQATCVATAPASNCAPRRCYCGGCPWWLPRDVMPTYTPDRYTTFDKGAVAKGQRRASLADYRHARGTAA